MKILIIDDSSDFRSLLRLLLKSTIFDPEIEEYNPLERGPPPDDFEWSRYDVLLLDYQLGLDEDGLDWLRTYKSKNGFPPTIVLTAEGDDYVATQALKLGAVAYSNKQDLSQRRLEFLIETALEDSVEQQQTEKTERNIAAGIIKSIQEESEVNPAKHPVDGYRLVRLIGKGASSQVYLADNGPDTGSLVLKLLDLTMVKNSSWIVRFKREATSIAELNSPFVVKIHDHGITQRYAFIAMEFFPRGDLKHRMELNITPNMAFNYMSHIAYALQAIHKIGVVHRDLKPANIMFRGNDSLALADFGISKNVEGDLDLTMAGQVLGTPYYMSPEQGKGGSIDTRTDIYSVGIMLYELLTGEKPYNGRTAMAVISEHVQADIPKLPASLSQYQEIIERCLAKKPDCRYQTAEELVAVLEQAEKETEL